MAAADAFSEDYSVYLYPAPSKLLCEGGSAKKNRHLDHRNILSAQTVNLSGKTGFLSTRLNSDSILSGTLYLLNELNNILVCNGNMVHII